MEVLVWCGGETRVVRGEGLCAARVLAAVAPAAPPGTFPEPSSPRFEELFKRKNKIES